MGRTLAAKALQVKEDKPQLQKVLEEAMAGTDCGDCGYPDCKGYSTALAYGKDTSTEKCAPGGADTKAMLETILVSLKTGKLPEAPAAPTDGAPAAAEAKAPAAPAADAPAGPPLAQTLPKEELFKHVLDAMAGTDCGDCEYPDCEGYAKGIVYEGQKDLDRCAPGGEDTRAKLFQIMLGTKPPPK
jgi:Na+-translocating ferredoxin:NAD+ oxidoreductase RNF subunit RnfB